MLFSQLLIYLPNKYRDNFIRGTVFEKIILKYFLTDKLYCADIHSIYLWRDFPFKKEFGSGHDVGIDLVVITHNAEFWAIQCKCYNADTIITKSQVNTFIATSSKLFKVNGIFKTFSRRFWISTSVKLTDHANNTLSNQNPPVVRINQYDLDKSGIDWEVLLNEQPLTWAQPKQLELRNYQIDAIGAIFKHYKIYNRGCLIMACGTGKTFTALRAAEMLAIFNRLVIIFSPSISLESQTLRLFANQTNETNLNKICVCSDPNVSASNVDQNSDFVTGETIDLAYPATTDPKTLYDTYLNFDKSNLTVIFSTYQSIDVIIEAQKLGLPEFDLIICDEAHRTTGSIKTPSQKHSYYIKVHSNDNINAKYRLYMTATPRLYSSTVKEKAKLSNSILCSMDDENIYGKVIYKLSFSQAVKLGCLVPYKLMVLMINERDPDIQNVKKFYDLLFDDKSKTKEQKRQEFLTLAKLAGCMNAFAKKLYLIDENVAYTEDSSYMRKVVAFCKTIKQSFTLVEKYNFITKANPDGFTKNNSNLTISCNHIDGHMSSLERESVLEWLKTDQTEPVTKREICKILSNVRCLSEGIDVPSLDSIVFLSAKNSQLEVVQSVGRVMRPAPNKKYGYIIIPLIFKADQSPEEILAQSEEFKVVWEVLTALLAHDESLESVIIQLQKNIKNKPNSVIICRPEPIADQIDDQFDSLNNISEADIYTIYKKFVLARFVEITDPKAYWIKWAKNVASLTKEHMFFLRKLSNDPKLKILFDNFIESLKKSTNNPNLNKPEILNMLAQHRITQPVFNALFEDYPFADFNPISLELNKFLESISKFSEFKESKELLEFYSSIKRRVSGLDNSIVKQEVVVELYNTFFKTAFPDISRDLGIVYTPIEIVDFIIQSVNDILEKEFGSTLTDVGVNILDPFTGTGTFITRLLQSGLIKTEDMERKFTKELFAYEIVLLAYYIASVNIENVYHDLMNTNKYVPFEGICLTDTFMTTEIAKKGHLIESANADRLFNHSQKPITVIMSNPPYSIHGSIDFSSSKIKYDDLDARIRDTYIKKRGPTLVKCLYDSYIRAFRWATDRIGNNNGIIGFVSNGSWLRSTSNQSLRECFEKEFAKIYIFDLKGDHNAIGDFAKKQGRNVFGDGCRTPIAITICLKRKNFIGRAEIHYVSIEDGMSRKEKLDIIKLSKSFLSYTMPKMRLLDLTQPGNWLTKENSLYKTFIPMCLDNSTKYNSSCKSVFTFFTHGIITSRDNWVFDYSKKTLNSKVNNFINHFNKQSLVGTFDKDPKSIAWSKKLISYSKRNIQISFDENSITKCSYRPFNVNFLYYSKLLNERRGFCDFLFPTKDSENLVITITGQSTKSMFSALMTDKYTSYDYLGHTRCFPRYYYNSPKSKFPNDYQSSLIEFSLFETTNKQDAISDYFKDLIELKYSHNVSKDDIFYYVYGIFHSIEYKNTYADDLHQTHPRIPIVQSFKDFTEFNQAGRNLAYLHLNYEHIPPIDQTIIQGDTSKTEVQKMRFSNVSDKETIIFNNHIKIKKIPSIAYDYILNGRSAIEHIMMQYQVKKDKKSGIVIDPNKWCEEIRNPKYILNLLLSIISVSVKTMEIVYNLPKIDLESSNSIDLN
ncbi:MAG: DEAD/DEAH box helicase family protein [Christensenellaceae bacterium]|jgi:predicted helicase|nr:DEAD/DEAH box helicase family protein [Christensenellaceae bacterium]